MSAKKEKMKRKQSKKVPQARENVIEYKGWSVTAYIVHGIFELHFGKEAAPARRLYPYSNLEIPSQNGSKLSGRAELLYRRLAVVDDLIAYDANPSPEIVRKQRSLGFFDRRSGLWQLMFAILSALVHVGIVIFLGILSLMIRMGLNAGL